MDFGHFSLMGYRDRGKPTEEIFREHAEQVRLADEAGIEAAWFAEHHFSNYCTCPSPLLMVAHCAGITKRIRLGTAIIVTPLYEPARLLAEIGMTDALAGGRLVLGLGSGYQPYEFDRFGVDLADSKEMLEEFLEMLRLAFTQETFSYQGKHYQLPETNISSRPANGIPEIWIAGDNPQIHRMCAREGHTPMFTGRWNAAPYLKQMRDRVAESYAAEGKDTEAMPLGVQRFMCVTDSKAEALEYVDNARHQMRLAAALRRRAEVMDGAMMNEIPIPSEIPLEEMADNLLVGDAETIAERLADEIQAARPSHMMFHMQVGGSGQTQALRTIEAFATDVRPMVEKAIGPLSEIGARPSAIAAE